MRVHGDLLFPHRNRKVFSEIHQLIPSIDLKTLVVSGFDELDMEGFLNTNPFTSASPDLTKIVLIFYFEQIAALNDSNGSAAQFRKEWEEDFTTIVDVTESVSKLAGRSEYQRRFVLDIGATDHIRNDASKFNSFVAGSYHAVINTGAGPMTVKEKDIIRLSVVRSGGPLGDFTIHGVMYTPTVFVLMLSHYQLKHERVYYHGLDDRVYHHVNCKDVEVAYTPEIEKVPSFLLTDDDIRAADILALVAVNATKKTSVLTPTRDVTRRDLHVTFAHTDVRTRSGRWSTT